MRAPKLVTQDGRPAWPTDTRRRARMAGRAV